MREITEKVYKFNELDENIKEKIINNYIEYLIDITDFETLHKNSNLYKAYKKSKELRTPWFIGQFVWDFCNKTILNNLKYEEFRKNGDLYI